MQTEIEINSNEASESPRLPYSSFARRTGAVLIDWAILGALGLFAMEVVPFLGSLIIWFFYAPILESSEIRATLGKHVLGIQVTDLNGGRISFRNSIIRNLMKVVSSAIFCIGYLFALFTSRKQSLHDMLADTVVVDGQSTTPISEAWVRGVRELFGNVSDSPPVRMNVDEAPRRAQADDVASQIERVRALRDQGVLTEEQFEAAKEKILRS